MEKLKYQLKLLQVACVLMFYLQKDDFPVDTHVSTSFNFFLFFLIFKQNSHS